MDALTRSAYGYADGNPLNGTDPTGMGCIFSNSKRCIGLGEIIHDAKHTAGTLLHEIVPGVPSYLNACIGGGYIGGGEVCLSRTRSGHWYLTPAVGLTTPGLIASFHGGYIHGCSNPSPAQVEGYLSGPVLTGSVGFAGSLSGVWGNERKTGNSDYGDEIGVSAPGASLMQGYGIRIP